MKWSKAHGVHRASGTDLPALTRLDDRRILLVADDHDNQRILRHLLEDAGAVVTIAANGREGLKAFEQPSNDGKPFDLILVDIRMPITDGIEAIRTFRAKGVKTPIVALAACALSGDIEVCLAAGCNDYLPNPITTESLLAKLAPYLPCGLSEKAPPASEEKPTTPASALVRSRLADDPRFASLVCDFQADLARRIDEMQTARETSDGEAIRTQAHRLTSAAGMLGFDELSAAAACCELAWREGRADKNEMLMRLLGWLRASHAGRRGENL